MVMGMRMRMEEGRKGMIWKKASKFQGIYTILSRVLTQRGVEKKAEPRKLEKQE